MNGNKCKKITFFILFKNKLFSFNHFNQVAKQIAFVKLQENSK